MPSIECGALNLHMHFRSLVHPRFLLERLAEESIQRRRLARLRRTAAKDLGIVHIDSLELLELLSEQPPQVIYDIGANIGTWTLLAKAVYPTAEIHAFEPLPRLAQPFLDNTRRLSQVHRHEVALGAVAAESPIKITDFVDASSFLELAELSTRHFNVHRREEEAVRVVRLDDYIRDQHVPPPCLIKFDIQGYELEAMRGAAGALGAARAVITEVSFVEFYKGQCLFHDIVGQLAESGYHLLALARCTPLGKPLMQTDALFVKNDIRAR
jgi:FkbM family methyltransferase